jgi:hypothetical protein
VPPTERETPAAQVSCQTPSGPRMSLSRGERSDTIETNLSASAHRSHLPIKVQRGPWLGGATTEVRHLMIGKAHGEHPELPMSGRLSQGRSEVPGHRSISNGQQPGADARRADDTVPTWDDGRLKQPDGWLGSRDRPA